MINIFTYPRNRAELMLLSEFTPGLSKVYNGIKYSASTRPSSVMLGGSPLQNWVTGQNLDMAADLSDYVIYIKIVSLSTVAQSGRKFNLTLRNAASSSRASYRTAMMGAEIFECVITGDEPLRYVYLDDVTVIGTPLFLTYLTYYRLNDIRGEFVIPGQDLKVLPVNLLEYGGVTADKNNPIDTNLEEYGSVPANPGNPLDVNLQKFLDVIAGPANPIDVQILSGGAPMEVNVKNFDATGRTQISAMRATYSAVQQANQPAQKVIGDLNS